MNRQLRAGFERYWEERVGQADALTPGQKKALVRELRRELCEEGRVILASGPVKVDPQQPIVRAALEGRPVSVGGGKVIEKEAQSLSDRMQALPLPLKLAGMGLALLLPCLVVGFVLLTRGGEEAVVVGTPTLTITLTPSPTVAAEALGSEATSTPVITPTLPVATPTPYAIALTSGSAAPSGNDPASLELGGFSYVLSAGETRNGQWVPVGAEWLSGTELRRVVAIPYEPALANAITTLRAGTVLKLRLRSGEIVKYRLVQVARIKRHEIETLASRTPSLAVVLHSEPSGERWLVLADAIQEPQDFTEYTIGVPGSSEPPLSGTTSGIIPTPVALPTLIPTLVQTVYTDSRTVTNEALDLTLTVGECEAVARIGELEPEDNKQGFYICPVTLQAEESGAGASYSGQTVGITEFAELQSAADWFPAPVRVAQALGEGSLSPGGSVTGNVAGVVKKGSSFGNKRDPVLVWEQAGTRYVIHLEP